MPRRNYIQKTTGRKVPGVTTYLGILAKPALIWWGYKQGMDNYERLSKDIAGYAKNIGWPKPTDDDRAIGSYLQDVIQSFPVLGLYDKRDQAADAGTLGHTLIECDLQEQPLPDTSTYPEAAKEKAEGCYLAFLDWKKNHALKVIGSEVPLTSEQWPYGGTIDHVIQTNVTPTGHVDILDIKTGKDIYLEAKIQVAAYGPLWNEHHPDQLVSGYHILRLGPNGEFTHKYFPTLNGKYFEIFLDCLDIKETLTQLGEKI